MSSVPYHPFYDIPKADVFLSVGDITPVEGVPVHVKHDLEEQAMDSFLNEMLGGEGNKDARARFRALFDVSVVMSDVAIAFLLTQSRRSMRLEKRQNQSWSR